MSMTYEELSKMTGISKTGVKIAQTNVKAIVGDGSIQGRLAAFRRASNTYFDVAQISAGKVANKFLFGLGVGGLTGYVNDKEHSNDAYKQGKAKAAKNLKKVLADLEQLHEYQLSAAIIEKFIKDLHEIRKELNELTATQRARFHTNSKGGRITQIFDGSKYQILMHRLAELYVFLKEKEQVEQTVRQKLAIKYPEKKNDLQVWPKSQPEADLPGREEKLREERALVTGYRPKPQPLQTQMAGALDKKEAEIERRFAKSGKGLFRLMEQQEADALARAKGSSREQDLAEAKFEKMIRKTFQARAAATRAGLWGETGKPKSGITPKSVSSDSSSLDNKHSSTPTP